jgi:hypothetical protein
MHRLAYDELANFRIVGLFHQSPDLASRITEPSERAQVLGITQRHLWAVKHLSLSRVRLPGRSLSSVETDVGV